MGRRLVFAVYSFQGSLALGIVIAGLLASFFLGSGEWGIPWIFQPIASFALAAGWIGGILFVTLRLPLTFEERKGRE